MALATLYTRALMGVDAPLVTVEVHLAGGLPNMTIVGMAETAVKESRDRVRSALINSQFEFPASRITRIWRRPICPRVAVVMTWPLPWAFWSPVGRCLRHH